MRIINTGPVRYWVGVSAFLNEISNCDVVLTGVWITTGGTMYSDVARYTGEALHTCMHHTGRTYRKPVLVGFASLRDVSNYNEIRQQSRSIGNVVTDEQVR